MSQESVSDEINNNLQQQNKPVSPVELNQELDSQVVHYDS